MPVKAWSRHDWSTQFPLDVLCMPRTGMRPADVGDGTSDCILVVGFSRPKIAAAFLTVALLSLFLTFHILYDSAVYSLRAAANKVIVAPIDDAPRASAPSSSSSSSSPPPALFVTGKAHFPRTTRQLPQAIIVGVRKCGTRALLEYLFLHPQIQKAAGEVHFFDRDDNYEKGLDWYRRKMPYSFRGQITIEKSPSYFVTPEVPERIYAMNSSVRLLLIVREPVTRAISDYAQLKSHAATASTNISSQPAPAPTRERRFEELALRADGTVNESYRPIAISIYHLHMARWLAVFNRRQILVVNGDQLIDDPLPQLKRIESFLRLEPYIGRHHFYFNQTKGFYCIRNDTEGKCLRETKGRRHPRVNPLVVAKLRKFFNEHNRRFYDLVGEDLGWPEE